ncbi:ABC transporter permease [Paucidesulfovibrio longus]|uniref:ABC transporter permease n=1 Tax=Paucidesulfovibrio longus TaxID=889 RepID=UPI0003B776C9|nr:ABC transporter permease [Paucidesulfovibrio longus]
MSKATGAVFGPSRSASARRGVDPFFWLSVAAGAMIMAYILLPLGQMLFAPTLESMVQAASDADVRNAVGLSLAAAGIAALISLIFGTPLAYLLARREFPGRKIVESLIDLPIMIPHPVVGIAILGLTGRNHWLGRTMQELGIRIMGTVTGIVVVLVFVGLPFYVNAAKAGFQAVPVRLEKAARTLGCSSGLAFLRVTLPLAWRSIVTGVIMCMARAISEFGAVIIVAYHPMVAPVMIYERFTAYGLKYSQPVAVWLICVSLALFLLLRLVSRGEEGALDRT